MAIQIIFLLYVNLFITSIFSFQNQNVPSIHKALALRYNYNNIGFHLYAAQSSSSSSINFDNDFADMISKPLPEWYKEQKEEEDRLLKEEEANRDRILREFREKYEDISEDQKVTEFENKISRKLKKGWIESLFSSPSSSSSTATDNKLDKTTREKWSDLMEEEKKAGFHLPSFFEVFPELKLKWPIWSKRKDGSAIKCEKDSDCQFPQACCQHPILPGEKFCCTGFGRRVLVPAYATIKVLADQAIPPKDGGGNNNSPPPRW